MALSGTLEADFTEFTDECAKATTAMGGMQEQADQSAASMKGLGDVPVGEKASESLKQTTAAAKETTGGLTEVTGAFKTVAGAVGIPLSIGGIVAVGKAAFDTADALVKTAETTGLTIDQVQRLQFVAEQSGNTLDDMTSAVSKLQKALTTVEGQKAIEDLGIDFRAFAAAKPYEQLTMVAEALGSMTDAADRSAKAQALLGKQGAEMAASLNADFKKTADAAMTASETSVKALEGFGDAISAVVGNLKTGLVTALGDAVVGAEEFGSNFVASLKLAAESGHWSQIFTNLRLVREAREAGAAKDIVLPSPAAAPKKTPKEIADELKAQKEAEAEAARMAREHADQQERLADAVARVTEARRGSEAILAELSAETRTAIEQDLKAGASQSDLALAYAETAGEVDKMAIAVREVANAMKAQDDATKAQADALAEVAAAERAWAEESRTRLMTQTALERNAIEQWKAAELEKLAAAQDMNIEHYTRIEQIAAEKLAAIGVNWDELQTSSTAYLEDVATRSEATYNQALAGGTAYSDAMKENYRQLAVEARAAADEAAGITPVASDAFTAVAAGAEQATAKTQQATGALMQMGGALNYVSAATMEAQARGMEFDAAENRRKGWGIAPAYARFQEEAARMMRERAATLYQREAYVAGGTPVARNPSSTLTVTVNNATAQDIAERLATEMRHQGVRF